MLGLGIANKVGLGKVTKNLVNLYRKIKGRRIEKKKNILVKKRNKEKIFVIGFNKTGTTSLGYTLECLGFIVANQMKGEILFHDWMEGKYGSIIEYCETGEVFQDVPFSLPETYKQIDKKYPNAKFILTVRDSPQQWYDSLIKFHGRMWGNGNIPPTVEDLTNANYIYKGFPLVSIKAVYGTTNKNPYDKEKLISRYNAHIREVKKYFEKDPNRLLVINIAKKEDFNRLVKFLSIQTSLDEFPHISSKDIANKKYECNFLTPYY